MKTSTSFAGAAGITLITLLTSASLESQSDNLFPGLKTFRCEFQDGEGRAVSAVKTSDRRGDKFSDPLIIDNVNYRSRQARLVGNAGGSDLQILRDGPLAVTFAEYTPPGGVSTITIYKIAEGVVATYRAVMSRHLVFTAATLTLSMTQYYGTCRGLP